MKRSTCAYRTLWLLALLSASGLWLRAADPVTPPAPPTEEKKTVEPPPPAVAPAPDAPEEDKDAVALQLAEKAQAEAEKIAEKAQADAEATAARAQAEAERIAEKARAAAEQTAEKALAAAERTIEKAHAKAAQVKEKAAQAGKKTAKKTHRAGAAHRDADDRVTVGQENIVTDGEKIPGDAVAVMGNLTVDGEVNGDAVAVMGDNTINGTVRGNAVAVMGKVKLGPKARLEGDIINVMGSVERDPEAVVLGSTQVQGIGPNVSFDSVSSWWDRGLKLGRPLAIGAHLGWLWIITAFSIAFYALLGLIFPDKIRRCGDKLTQEPGMVILAGVLAILALPVLFVLLLITIIGIPVALLVLPVGTLLVAMFGKAAIYGLVGRKVSGDKLSVALAVVLGALIFVLLYLVPFLGLLISLLVWFLGFGCAMVSIFSRSPKAAPVAATSAPRFEPVSPVVPVPPSAGFTSGAATGGLAAAAPARADLPPVVSEAAAASAPEGAAAFTAPSAAPVPPPLPRPLTADTLPRAGFWIRVGAAFLDLMLIMIPAGILGLFKFGPGVPFLIFVAYHAAMWVHKGTTIGGVICGLKVVRLDDRPIDWTVAIVRALTAFLSLIPCFLGFIWVAFDDDKQSWHDKVAGTTIVRVPKGTALL